MSSDSVADLLTIIRNGYMARRASVWAPPSKLSQAILAILKDQNYIEDYVDKNHKLEIKLRYVNKKPAVLTIRRISKPGRRMYVSRKRLPRVLGGLGIAIVSTPKGLMVEKEARRKGLGGEVVCEVW